MDASPSPRHLPWSLQAYGGQVVGSRRADIGSGYEGQSRTPRRSRGQNFRAPTRALALRRLQREAAQGLPAPPERLTVATFCSQRLERVTPRLRESTARRHPQLVTLQILPTWGAHSASQPVASGGAAGLATLRAAGLSPRTCAHVRATCERLCTIASGGAPGPSNSAALASAPRVPHTAPRALTPSGARAVLAPLEDSSLHRLWSLAIHTGLRQGEMLGLRPDQAARAADDVEHPAGILNRAQGEFGCAVCYLMVQAPTPALLISLISGFEGTDIALSRHPTIVVARSGLVGHRFWNLGEEL